MAQRWQLRGGGRPLRRGRGLLGFDYPAIRFVLGFLFTALFFALVVNAVVNYPYGGLQIQASGGDRVARGARCS